MAGCGEDGGVHRREGGAVPLPEQQRGWCWCLMGTSGRGHTDPPPPPRLLKDPEVLNTRLKITLGADVSRSRR